MSEKNKNRASKRWLISRMKTSGSKRRYVYSQDYANTRNSKRKQKLEELPNFEGMSKSREFYNGKINTSLLKRFLINQVGKDWDEVHEEIVSRIPTKLLDYKDCIYWYVADKVEIIDGNLWNKRNQHFIFTNTNEVYQYKKNYRYIDYYVDPETNKLLRIGDFKSRKQTRDLSEKELQKFRENEKNKSLDSKNLKKENQQIQEENIIQLLREHNQKK